MYVCVHICYYSSIWLHLSLQGNTGSVRGRGVRTEVCTATIMMSCEYIAGETCFCFWSIFKLRISKI